VAVGANKISNGISTTKRSIGVANGKQQLQEVCALIFFSNLQMMVGAK
jgi:hypothetical protein